MKDWTDDKKLVENVFFVLMLLLLGTWCYDAFLYSDMDMKNSVMRTLIILEFIISTMVTCVWGIIVLS